MKYESLKARASLHPASRIAVVRFSRGWPEAQTCLNHPREAQTAVEAAMNQALAEFELRPGEDVGYEPADIPAAVRKCAGCETRHVEVPLQVKRKEPPAQPAAPAAAKP